MRKFIQFLPVLKKKKKKIESQTQKGTKNQEM